jgi:hypothetical protein
MNVNLDTEKLAKVLADIKIANLGNAEYAILAAIVNANLVKRANKLLEGGAV